MNPWHWGQRTCFPAVAPATFRLWLQWGQAICIGCVIGDLGYRAACDPFVPSTEVFANIDGEVIDAVIDERFGHR